jgi:1,5-anhydro-D-fructose reductase (1,5-anhydro-D-mannitol-forming)
MVRFGIVGFGLHAVKRLMPGFALAKRCQVTALSRRTLDKARASAHEFQIPLAFDSADQLCASPEVDAVFIATPNSFHLADVLTAIRHGKPVLCEKPLGMNADECRMMVEAAEEAPVLFGVAQVFRFENSTHWLRKQVAEEKIGTPVFARSEFSFLASGTHPRTWIADATIAGGGPIADVGVHCIDTLRFVLQDEVVRVTVRGTPDDRASDIESSAVLTLEFSRGTLGAVLVSTRSEYRTPFEIVGTNGILRADDALNVERPIQMNLLRGREIIESETLSNFDAYARQVDAFADAARGLAAFPAPGIEGWQNQKVLDAAYRSLRSGKTEDVR